MKIHTSEIEFLREEVKNCHKIIKELQKKREFVGLTDAEIAEACGWKASDEYKPKPLLQELQIGKAIEAKLKEKNT